MPGTDEDILATLMHRCTDDVHAPASIAAQVVTRQRCRDRRGRILTLTATTAALGTAAGVVALVPRQAAPSPGGHHIRPAITLTAAQRTLYRLSSVAANAPQGQGRYVVMREIQDNYKKMSVIDSLTGDVWTYQQGGGVPAELPLAATIPDPGPFRRHAHRSGRAAGAAYLPVRPGAEAGRRGHGGPAEAEGQDPPAATHRPTHQAAQADPRRQVFEQANLLLWNPLVPPALRSAVFKVLAATPGVQVNSHARDDRGRPGRRDQLVRPRHQCHPGHVRVRPPRGCSSRRMWLRPPRSTGTPAPPAGTCTCPSPGPGALKPNPYR